MDYFRVSTNIVYSVDYQKKRILITGGRSFVTLDLARYLNHAGHTVFVADPHRIHYCLFSNAVKKSYTVPSPRFHSEAFVQKIIDIVKKEKIDCIIPIFEEVIILSQVLNRIPCEVFCSSFETLHALHNKWFFYSKLRSYGILSPETKLIESFEELMQLRFSKPQILKPCYSRGSVNIKRVESNRACPSIEIKKHNPWIAQEWLDGKKYCSYSICRKGKLQAHVVYPYLFNEDHYCLHFEMIDHPGILAWIEKFIALESFTGQIAFDFIETKDGLYAIECNPRATFGFNLFNAQDEIHQAFFEPLNEPIFPPIGRTKQVAAAMIVYGWRNIQFRKHLGIFLKKMLSTKDIAFSLKDIKPFLFQPIILLSYCYRAFKWKKNIIDLYLFDIEWNGNFSLEEKPSRAMKKI